MLGHVQAHAPGWRKDRAMDRTLPGAAATVEALRREPGVAGATARVYAPALAALGEEGFAVVVLGLDCGGEPDRPGCSPARPRPRPGAACSWGGARRADGREPGDEVALVGQGVDGSLANDLFTVAGLVETSVDLVNRQAVVMELAEAQELFAMPDEAHEIVVHAASPRARRRWRRRLAALPPLAGAEVLDWQTLAPEMVTLVRFVEVAWVFVLVLVFVAAAAGVANTMLMATFERTHELGMLLALGTAPGASSAWSVPRRSASGAGRARRRGARRRDRRDHARTGIDYAALTGGGPDELSFAGLRWSLVFYPRLALVDVCAARSPSWSPRSSPPPGRRCAPRGSSPRRR